MRGAAPVQRPARPGEEAMSTSQPRFRIGTRGSALALAQARMVARALAAAHGLDVETACAIVPITTTGDKVQSRALNEIGGKGLFTKEIEEALLADDVDVAVHSMKDMPTRLPPGLEIAAILEREDPRDVFIGHGFAHPDALPQGARIGTASLRRGAQMRARRSDLEVVVLRGNVETRLRKVQAGEVSGTLLAKAGLNRLGIEDVGVVLPVDEMLPAVAQGAVGIEIRSSNTVMREHIMPLNHWETAAAVGAERAFLGVLDGSCRTPIAGYAEMVRGKLSLRGLVLSPDGRRRWTVERRGTPEEAVRMGREAGEALRQDMRSDGVEPASLLAHGAL